MRSVAGGRPRRRVARRALGLAVDDREDRVYPGLGDIGDENPDPAGL